MELKDIQNAGSDILNAVSDAVAKGDYSNLSTDIRRSVATITEGLNSGELSKAMQEALQKSGMQVPATTAGAGNARTSAAASNETARAEQKAIRKQATKPIEGEPTYPYTEVMEEAMQQPEWQQQNGLFLPPGVTQNRRNYFFRQGWKRVSPYYGAGQFIAGIMSSVVTGGIAGAFIISGILSPVFKAGLFTIGAIFAAVFLACALLMIRGGRMRSLYQHYREYGRHLGTEDHILIADLAKLTGRDEAAIIKDIKECIKAGFLPETWFDATESAIMVNAEAYNQYVRADAGYKERREKDAQWAQSLSRMQNAAEVQEILKEGNGYIEVVRACNNRIPDPEISAKISRLENIMGKIFTEVRRQPAAAPQLRKFMSYYLPTTVKLLNAYAELDEKGEEGENIVRTKREINDSLDLINDGFENLFDSMFQDMSWDISSDISVMKTMMAQDGLAYDAVDVPRME